LKGVLIGPCVEAQSSRRSVTAAEREYFKRGEEVHELLRLVLIAHPHFAEIMLRKFTRQVFEPDQRRHDVDPKPLQFPLPEADSRPRVTPIR
jgi:hypothetical protein